MAESNLLDELKRTEIQIIDKKERPKNGFVLSEKSIFGVLEEAGKTDKRLPDPVCSGCEIQKVGCGKERQ